MVQSYSRWDTLDADVLDIALATAHSGQVLEDFLETRRILEVAAVALAAERGSERRLDNIRATYERLEEAAKATALNPMSEAHFVKAHAAFHGAFFRATGNVTLIKMLEPLQKALQTAMQALVRPDHHIMQTLLNHERIMKTVTNRDLEGARAAMDEHLAASLVYFESIQTP